MTTWIHLPVASHRLPVDDTGDHHVAAWRRARRAERPRRRQHR